MANIAIVHTITHDENKPAGSRARSLGDDDIREAKADTRERFAVDHVALADESGEAAIGIHKQVTMRAAAGDLTAYEDVGRVYAKVVSGIIELFFIDSAGNATQITSGGKLNDTVQAKQGDWLASSVTTARAGWTNVSATYSNKFIRINATPLTTGGADTHTTPAHTLTTAEIPAHTHTYYTSGASGVGTTAYAGQSASYAGGGPTDANTGGGGGHTHDAADNVPVYVQGVLFQKD